MHTTEARRRGLPAAPPGACSSPAAAVLFNPSLLARILGLDRLLDAAGMSVADSDLDFEPPPELGAIRRVCKDARVAFDRGCELPLVFGPPPGGYATTLDDAIKWTLGMLRRGRRPRAVRIWFGDHKQSLEWGFGALELLQALPRLSGRPTDSVSRLTLPAELLSPLDGALVSGAFPCLTRLVFTDAGSRQAAAAAVEDLALLLLGRRGVESGSDIASPSEPLAPLLPALTELGMTGTRGLPDGTAAILAAATHVRSLDLSDGTFSEESMDGSDRRSLGQLGSIVHLCGLRIGHCAPSLLPVLTGALTRLTSLELTQQEDVEPLPTALFAPLKRLQRLHAPNAVLHVEGLAEALSALTDLNVNTLTCSGFERNEPLTSVPRWALPPGLRRLGLSTDPLSYTPQSLEVLAGLDPPAGMELDPESMVNVLHIMPGRHAIDDDEDGDEDDDNEDRLIPAAEEALCGAVAFMQRHGLHVGDELHVEYETKVQSAALLKVGEVLCPVRVDTEGRDHAASHGRWLQSLRALAPRRLTLQGIYLSYNDIRTIRDGLTTLESLVFKTPTDLHLPAIPLLSGLPRLRSLGLDATPWAIPVSRYILEGSGKGTAALVGLALSLHEGPAQRAGGERPRPLDLDLLYGQGRTEHEQRSVHGAGRQIVRELKKAGVEGVRVLVEGRVVTVGGQESEG